MTKPSYGPLQGLKILDFSTLLPGPFASMLLADMGAEVLKIEAPNRHDLVREMRPFEHGVSATHAMLNRSKSSMSLNLKHPDAIDVVQALVKEYDIVIEQFRPGVMARLGLDYDTLVKSQANLIYCSITGYGQKGAYQMRAGHDINYIAMSGIAGYSGTKKSGPSLMGVQMADISGSWNAVMGILAAVIHRQNSGQGQHIDVSMTEAVKSMNIFAATELLVGAQETEREGGMFNGGTFYDFYASSDGRYLSLGGLEPKFWKGLCDCLGLEELIEKQFDPKTKPVLIQTIKSRDFDHWQGFFAALDICVEPVLSLEEALEHPLSKDCGTIAEVPVKDGISQKQLAFPVHFSKTPAAYKHIGPLIGESNQKKLEKLGYNQTQIAEFFKSGLCGKEG